MRRLIITSIMSAMIATLAIAGCNRSSAPPTPTAEPSTATPVARASPTPVGAFITIDGPLDGAIVAVPIHISGGAEVFEAALTVDVLDASGSRLCIRHIMARSGTGTPATWATTMAFPPPGAPQPVTVRGYSFSAKDGSIQNLVKRDVIVSTHRPAIFITSPLCGATVAPGTTLAVQGRAFVFEAALTVELRDASGTAVLTQNVMADNGTEESDFRSAFAIPAALPSGPYDLVAFDHSAKDGSVENEFAIQVEVAP
jgi:hypothetical protein